MNSGGLLPKIGSPQLARASAPAEQAWRHIRYYRLRWTTSISLPN